MGKVEYSEEAALAAINDIKDDGVFIHSNIISENERDFINTAQAYQYHCGYSEDEALLASKNAVFG